MPLSKNGSLISKNSPSGLKPWILAARPKTLIAGLSPVLIGTALSGVNSWSLFFFTMSFSLLIQIGTNYANDYYDFIQGADRERVGPARAVTSGWIEPTAMRSGAFCLFAIAFLASIPLVLTSGLWALLFVISSIAFGILYTGGPKPLGYVGLGELLVLTYFGPIAVSGAYFVQTHMIDPKMLLLSLCPGLLSSAILVANNLRDMDTDRKAKKNTLIVRFGRTFGAWEYAICVSTALLLPAALGIYAPLVLAPLALFLIYKASTFRKSEEAKPLLAQTALLLILFTAFFCLETLAF